MKHIKHGCLMTSALMLWVGFIYFVQSFGNIGTLLAVFFMLSSIWALVDFLVGE